jgi:DNA-binding transcriptional regulator YiaG
VTAPQERVAALPGSESSSFGPVVVRAVAPVREWTGGDASALRRALRMTEAGFGRVAGVSVRTVSKWAAHPGMVPRNAVQARLDGLFAAASPAVLIRFARFTGRQPGGPSVPGGAAGGGRVVSLAGHPRYAADFRALAAGQVLAARSALGLTPGEFAEWLGTATGWAPGPGTVEAWEAAVVVPPGDVVMAARFCLAGAL